MISQSLYRKLAGCSSANSEAEAMEIWDFDHPYVLVIHKPTGNGFYLNRKYRHIIDVTNCKEPKNTTQVRREHLCAGPNLPAWLDETEMGVHLAENTRDFDTFWLY